MKQISAAFKNYPAKVPSCKKSMAARVKLMNVANIKVCESVRTVYKTECLQRAKGESTWSGASVLLTGMTLAALVPLF